MVWSPLKDLKNSSLASGEGCFANMVYILILNVRSFLLWRYRTNQCWSQVGWNTLTSPSKESESYSYHFSINQMALKKDCSTKDDLIYTMYLRIFWLIVIFKGKRPSSVLQAKLEALLLTSEKTFVKLEVCLFDLWAVPGLKIWFGIHAPNFTIICQNRRDCRIKYFTSKRCS